MELVRMGQYELTLSAIRTAERDRDFLFTPPYFVLTPVLYAPKSVALASVRTSADLERLKLCGRFGYAYTGYGVPESLVDRGAKTLEAAVGMLRAGRCDVFLGDAEVIAGESRLAGHPIFPDAEFTTRAPPDATAEPMSMMIGRALPQAEALLALLTDGIRDMKAAGAEQALSRRYLAPVSP
jgi:polar amino acid transport system substrate-binding protein